MIISDSRSLYVLRYAINDLSPSLYFLNATDGLWVASEKFDNKPDWKVFPEKKLMVAKHADAVQWIDL